MRRVARRKRKKNKSNSRAGILILKATPMGYRILCLRIYGSYDLPKGSVELGEDIFTAAIRETEEESGITDLNFEWGFIATQARNVTLFIATTEQEPVIRPNPQTGEYEHHSACWMTLNQAEQRLHPYLRSTVGWVRKIIGDV